MAFVNFLKATVITLLGFAAVGLATWGLITKGATPDGATMAVGGLLAYALVWIIALFMIKWTSPA